MKLPRYFTFQSIRLIAVVCVCVLTIMGCSDSSESGDVNVANESIADNTDLDNETSIDGSSSAGMNSDADESVENTDSETNQSEESVGTPAEQEQPATEDSDGISGIDDLDEGSNPDEVSTLQPAQVSLELLPDKTFRIIWQATPSANSYKVFENPDGVSGFVEISDELDANTTSLDHRVALYSRVNARYLVQSCNSQACVDSEPVMVTDTLDAAVGYFKASNTEAGAKFGVAANISADGNILAVGAYQEAGAATGVNGEQDSIANPLLNSGAVYVFVRAEGFWRQQAYIKASNTESGDEFGRVVSLSANGNTLVVGARAEDSSATGINGDQNDNSALSSGAVYVFVRDGELWRQQAYLKASNTDNADNFGQSVSLSADGNALAIGAFGEESGAAGINADEDDNSVSLSGAVYMFTRSGELWQQQAYVKASNPGEFDNFGWSVSLSADGETLAVGARSEDSAATGIDGDQNDNSLLNSGAVYVFALRDGLWEQQAYVKASNAGRINLFGASVSLSAEGSTLAIGAYQENGATTGINGDQSGSSATPETGAVYVFIRNASLWQQQAYLKASNADEFDRFGFAVSLSSDGNTLAVTAAGEDSAATGVNGDQRDNVIPPNAGAGNLHGAGAAYVFVRNDALWRQQAYIKASNTSRGETIGSQNVTSSAFDGFGASVSLSAEGDTLAIGAINESSATTGFDGDQTDDSKAMSGAVYIY